MLVGFRTDHSHDEAINSIVQIAECEVVGKSGTGQWPDVYGALEVSVPSTHLQMYQKNVGGGALLILVGTEWLSRERLGHAFAVPGSERRQLYETAFQFVTGAGRLAPDNRRTYEILN